MSADRLYGKPTVPCKFCDKPTPMTNTKMCDGCWETEHRIEDFLRTGTKAQTFVLETLAKIVGEEDD